MISRKFRPGQKVFYVYPPETGTRNYGIVVPYDQAETQHRSAYGLQSDILAVWAHWSEDKHIGFMPEDEAFSEEPTIQRKLPDWW